MKDITRKILEKENQIEVSNNVDNLKWNRIKGNVFPLLNQTTFLD